MKVKTKCTSWQILFRSFLASTLLTIRQGCGSTESLVEEMPEKIQVKVVIVTMFEIGEDEGDQAGELSLIHI